MKTVKNIVKGTLMRLLPISEMAKLRLEECEQCEFQTWLTFSEFSSWLIKNGVDVTKNLDHLEDLSDLPKKECKEGTGRYCMRCKCNVEGSARVVEKQCSEGKWEGLELEVTQEYKKITWLLCRQCEHNRFQNIRGVCAKSKAYFPIVAKHKPRQRILDDGFIIKEMRGLCLLGYWPSPEGEPAKNIPLWLYEKTCMLVSGL